MNIGVFGDSFAASLPTEASSPWWKLLELIGGHTVISHGMSGSSIIYSADRINTLARYYDFVIWCVTDPNRMTTIVDNDQYLHFSLGRPGHGFDHDDPYHQKLRDISHDYQKYFECSSYLRLTSIALINYIQTQFDHVMIIPCFEIYPKVLGLGKDFNLSTVANNELKHWGVDPVIVYAEYIEQRATHLCQNNNRILAELVNAKLEPGVFTASYDQFQPPDAPFDYYFRKSNRI